jgi:hypothetical protein
MSKPYQAGGKRAGFAAYPRKVMAVDGVYRHAYFA